MASRIAGARPHRKARPGDSASLWNITASPGWTKEEAGILKLCLMKYGVGKWKEIQESGLLPGKLCQQLSAQTQRLLGQQSLAAYTGLHVDIDRIRADNERRDDVERKAGLIIWSGPNPTTQMKEEWRELSQQTYGLTEQQITEAAAALEEAKKAKGLSIPLMDPPARDLCKEHPVGSSAAAEEKTGGVGWPPGSSHGWTAALYIRGPRVPLRLKSGLCSPSSVQEHSLQEPAAACSRAEKRVPKSTKRQPCGWKSRKRPYAAEVTPEVARLVAMGYPELKAKVALEECYGDLNEAVHWLLANCV